MPRLKAVHGAVDYGDGVYLADIDLEWEDGTIERCPYGVHPDDGAPIGTQIALMIARGDIEISQPPLPAKPTLDDEGGPDVIA